jgi:hypothetical protein
MINLRLAKSHMENEEGMNHLWIKIIPPIDITDKICIYIDLPEGVHRLSNLNSYMEDEQGWINIENVFGEQDLMVEIYTTSPIPCREYLIHTKVHFKKSDQVTKTMDSSITLSIVSEENMDVMIVDEKVVLRVKELTGKTDANNDRDFVIIFPKHQNIYNELSELEKKYRITF